MAWVEDRNGYGVGRYMDEYEKIKSKKLWKHTDAKHKRAQVWATNKEDDARERRLMRHVPKQSLPFAKAWEQYQQEVEKKPNSMTRDSFSMISLLEEFSNDDLGSITLDRLKTYKVKRRKGYTVVKKDKTIRRNPVKGPTINRELSLISHLFTHFKVTPDPTKEVKRFKEHEIIRFLEKEQIPLLLNQSVPYQRPIIQTALNTAFSVIDILKLTWAQINFDRRTITLARTKTDVPMLQPMTDELVRVLQSLPRHPTSPYVFCNEEGEPYKRIIKGFKAACKRAGIHDFRFHDLRHTFASQYLMNGGDLQTLKVLMGHKSISTTSKYAHFVQKHLANEIKRLDNLFGGK